MGIVHGPVLTKKPEGSVSWDGRRLTSEWTEEYNVHFDTNETPYAVVLALAIPVGYVSPNIGDPYARATKVQPIAHEKAQASGRVIYKWLIRVSYTNQFSDDDANESNEQPDNRRTRFRTGSTRVTVPLTHDVITGAAVENKAAQAIPAETEIVIPTLTLSRFEAVPNVPTLMNLKAAYQNRVNSAAFLGRPAKTVWLSDIDSADEETGQNEVWQGVLYVRTDYTFYFSMDEKPERFGWLLKLVNVGTRLRPVAGSDDFAPYTTIPQDGVMGGKTEMIDGPLNADGTRRTAAGLLILPQCTDPPSNADGFNRYQTADFNDLNLF